MFLKIGVNYKKMWPACFSKITWKEKWIYQKFLWGWFYVIQKEFNDTKSYIDSTYR